MKIYMSIEQIFIKYKNIFITFYMKKMLEEKI